MRALASFIMNGRSQAALVAAGCALLFLVAPPLLVISGGAVALVTLRRGALEGGVVLAVASLGSAVFAWLVFSTPAALLGVLPLFWLPLWLLALALRATVSLARTLQVAMLMGSVAVLLFYLVLGDPTLWWTQLLDGIRASMASVGDAQQQAALDQWLEALTVWAPLLPGMLVVSVLVWVLLGLLLARWWQALLYNPGGFQSEFHALRLGRPMAAGTLGIMAMAWLTGLPLLGNLALVLVLIYAIQGVAVVHGLVGLRRLATIWLVAFYVLLLFTWELVALLGVADAWADFRARVKPKLGRS